ncbi:MAG: glutamate-cysteine ligase family protein [Gammaproteobacteria bacterium]|nr:glutamate-cysteine ligase family protein [Gammaproteobacteria bacterium]
MGEEISHRYFDADHFSRFRQKLDNETRHIATLFENESFSTRGDILGFELEACIVDSAGRPASINKELLAEFNVELNGSPVSVSGKVFSRLHDELRNTWITCCESAIRCNARLISVGILPTIEPDILDSSRMSDMVRYHALNDRILALRDGAPLHIAICGLEELLMDHHDVMLEAVTTAFQVHLQCKPENSVSDFNASLVASAPIVALSANSPFLFGKSLWCESRIPLFEQAISVGKKYPSRVSFGKDYIHHTLFEIFQENQSVHPILIPYVQDEPIEKLAHLRFQNGTIWRWNRPLVGFDYDGQPHIRIEHRVIPSGPTIIDCVANCAAFYGFVRGLANLEAPIEERISFSVAQANFYAAAKDGLDAKIVWTDGETPVRKLILDSLLPMAREAFESMEIPSAEIDEYLGILHARAETGQNGASWQRAWVEKHGADFEGLVQAYMDLQETDKPVHTWPT